MTLAFARLAPSRLLALAALVGALGAGALVAAGRLVARTEAPAAAAGAADGAREVARLLRGIPQAGNALGRPEAPVTLVEYADLQCPYCGEWARETFPVLVREYVRTGKLRIVWHGLAFVGADSRAALATAVAAGQQDRLFDVVELLYRNQGVENSGWVTDSLLRRIGAAVPRLDVERTLRERGSDAVLAAMASAELAARTDRVPGTPYFLAGRTGGAPAPLPVASLAPEAFRRALDRLLAS